MKKLQSFLFIIFPPMNKDFSHKNLLTKSQKQSGLRKRLLHKIYSVVIVMLDTDNKTVQLTFVEDQSKSK